MMIDPGRTLQRGQRHKANPTLRLRAGEGKEGNQWDSQRDPLPALAEPHDKGSIHSESFEKHSEPRVAGSSKFSGKDRG
eukprot:5040088-Amphidinium_carterae.1